MEAPFGSKHFLGSLIQLKLNIDLVWQKKKKNQKNFGIIRKTYLKNFGDKNSRLNILNFQKNRTSFQHPLPNSPPK